MPRFFKYAAHRLSTQLSILRIAHGVTANQLGAQLSGPMRWPSLSKVVPASVRPAPHSPSAPGWLKTYRDV
jgi:hypothetical protein